MIVRIPNWLGDALMATPVYENLKEAEELILFGPKAFLKLFEDFPRVSLLPFYKKETSKNVENLKKFSHHKGLLLTNSFSSAWLFFRARIKERLGYNTDLRGILLTHKIPPPKEKLHQRDKYLYLIEKLGYPVFKKDLVFYLKEEKIEVAKRVLQKMGIPLDRPIILFAPGAAYGPAKKWPEKYYKLLAKNLLKKGFRILILGSSLETTLGDYIAENLEGVDNLCGKLEIELLPGIFKLSKALISNDSGLMHLGAALRIPQVAIFGSTDPALTGPLNSKAKIISHNLPCSPCFKRTCPNGNYLCLYDILPQEVEETLYTLL